MATNIELFIPEQLDTLQLSAAVKSSVAAGTQLDKKVKINISSVVDRVTLVVSGSSNEQQTVVKLVEPNAIVRFITGETALQSKLIDFEQSALYPIVSRAERLDPEVGAQLVPLLPKTEAGSESVILFGDLHALVMARGRPALAAEAEVVMWHQKLVSNPRVKAAMAEALKADYIKPAKESAASKAQPAKAAAAGAAGAAGTTARAASNNPPPVNVPTPTGPTVDSSVTLEPQQHPILPKEGKKNVLITSALPYVNNVPHLGNIVGSVLSADFYARYCKARGYNTLFICGTDEYGTATETKAIEENVTPQQLCTHYHAVHKEVYDWFQIGFDYFGRTSTDKQTEIAQGIFMKLYENGYLEEQPMEQLYCTQHNGYLADRFVEGTCPKCGYEDARGDQCDKCGQLLDPFELINPRCKLDNATPVRRETKHIFLQLDKLQPRLEEWLSTTIETWPKNAQTITQNWLREGLRPRAITRDLKWGTPLPIKGYEDKVLYVWFDAPIGYPSITANYTDEWKQWWLPENKKEQNLSLYQFMGKDNAPFHAVIFPSCEIGTNQPWNIVDYLSTTEYLQYEGGKFSKSRNIGVFGNNAKDAGVSASVWRYYLASVRPETSDTQFSWSSFVSRNNTELLANLGNFVNRVVKFTIAKYGGGVPEFKQLPADSPEIVDLNERLQQYVVAMDECHLRDGINHAMRFSARGNQYLQESKLDNTLFAEHPEKCAQVIGTALNVIYILSALISPFMPETTEKIVEQLKVPNRVIPDSVDFAIKPGHRLGKAQYLFSRIDDKKIDEWKAAFGGGSGAAAVQDSLDQEKEAKKAQKQQKKEQMKQQQKQQQGGGQ